MLSKFSRIILNCPFRINPVLASNTTKSIFQCTNLQVFTRSFHLNSHELQKIAPKPSAKMKKPEDLSAQSIGYYTMAVAILCAGLTFAAVPLYRLFCQVNVNVKPIAIHYSYQWFSQQAMVGQWTKAMMPARWRTWRESEIACLKFNSMPTQRLQCDGTSNHNNMKLRFVRVWICFHFLLLSEQTSQWNLSFNVVQVVPGETALAFYTARNPTDVPVIGVSTYNVIPFEAGQYFNKIQCFCFEAQQLNPHEEVRIRILHSNSFWFKSLFHLAFDFISGWYASILLHWPWIRWRP